MARASNSGISSVIAPSGEVLAKIGLGEKGAVYSSIRPMDGISPYHRYGNVMVMISLAVSIISMFLMAFPALRKRLDMPLQ
jgi:apolipoprotein N-acyltransferase